MVCYKSIYINTYNILLLNLETGMIIYRYEMHHSWETSITSILLQSHNLVICSPHGKRAINLGDNDFKEVLDKDGYTTKMHALESCNELKLEKSNHLLFQFINNQMYISVQEQTTDETGETHLDDIQKFKIDEMSLRDLMLF